MLQLRVLRVRQCVNVLDILRHNHSVLIPQVDLVAFCFPSDADVCGDLRTCSSELMRGS